MLRGFGSYSRPWATLLCGLIILIAIAWGRVSPLAAQETEAGNLVSDLGEHLEQGYVNCSLVSYGDIKMQGIDFDAATQSTGEILIMLNDPIYVDQPNPDGATPVGIGLYIIEIAEIDPSDNTYQVDGFLDLTWCDPRESFDPEVEGFDTEVYLEKDVELRLERMWWPDVEFVNEISPRSVENEELLIQPDGSVEYREKFSAQLAADYDMRRFPFDTQTLTMEIESFAWSSDDLIFVVEDEIIGFTDEFSIPEWTITSVEEGLETKQESRDRNPYSQLTVDIHVERDPGFYLTKIMIPLMIITAISWAVFWMVGDGLADRMSVSFTGVLAAVAYQFIISEALPRHVYNTFMDAMVLFSFVVMTLTILENIIVNNLYLREYEDMANRFDRISRFVFPVLYFGGIAILGLLYLAN